MIMEFVELTREEMLGLWRLRRHLEPLRSDAAVRRSDGVDLDRLCLTEMDMWYAGQLRSLPLECLPLVDCVERAAVERLPDGGAWRVTLPPEAVRVAAVRAEGWQCDAEIVIASGSPERVAEQACRFTRGGECRPVAVLTEGNTLLLYTPAPSAQRLVSLKCALLPSDGIYRLTPCMMPPLMADCC